MNGNLNKHTLDYITVLSMVNQLSITAYNKVCIKIHQFATNIRTLQKEHKTGLTSLRASVKRSSTFLSNHLIIGRNISGAVKRWCCVYCDDTQLCSDLDTKLTNNVTSASVYTCH